MSMLKITIVTGLLCMFGFFVVHAQNVSRGAIVTHKIGFRNSDGSTSVSLDTFYVRNGYILEPIKQIYSSDETNLTTGESRTTGSGSRLKWYTFTNFQEKNGMMFDIEKSSSSPIIEPYRLRMGERKMGQMFFPEPFLYYGVRVTDYSKVRDTIINGQKCFLLKRDKAVSISQNGKVVANVVNFRLAINPSLKSYNFPFISEKIVQHFGGGAVVYVEGGDESGIRSTVEYTYTEFTPTETKLFDYYQALYNSNIALFPGNSFQ